MNRYEYASIEKEPAGKRIFDISSMPVFESTNTDIYIITNTGDRLDLLAHRYYNDVTMWWIIASTNSEYFTGGFNIKPGVLLRIPFPVTITDASSKLSNAQRNK